MLDKPAKNNQGSWETVQAFSVFLLFVLRPDIESIFTLIGLSLMLIGLGISPLSIIVKPENTWALSKTQHHLAGEVS